MGLTAVRLLKGKKKMRKCLVPALVCATLASAAWGRPRRRRPWAQAFDRLQPNRTVPLADRWPRPPPPPLTPAQLEIINQKRKWVAGADAAYAKDAREHDGREGGAVSRSHAVKVHGDVGRFAAQLDPRELRGGEEHLAAARRNPAPFLAASCLGFFVNLASLAVIQHAGSMTLKIVSQLKNVVVICAAVVVYDDVVSALVLAGYAIAICGFGMYQDAKNRAAEFVAAEAEARGGEFRSVAGDGASETKNAAGDGATKTRDGAARYRPRSGSGSGVS